MKEVPVPAVGKLGSLGEDVGQNPFCIYWLKNLKNILGLLRAVVIPKSNHKCLRFLSHYYTISGLMSLKI